ncbi:MAG: J domain-containing protein [Acidimicrobiales bacterium]|nr:J domain-containing protein [Acidimicrobiales bacterium]
METSEAWAVLGLAPGASRAEIRSAYRSLVRALHPDHASAHQISRATERTAAVTEAYALVLRELDRQHQCPTASHESAQSQAGAIADVRIAGNDTLTIDAPPDEAYLILYEAAGNVGEISYYDQQLGIVEMIVRFEGGPSCSVVMTLQGRATHTEVLCAITSIEAEPTPAIAPVLEALLAQLLPDKAHP